MLDTEVDPLVDQLFEPLMGRDLAANLLQRFLTYILRAALHPAGIAELPIGSDMALGIFLLAGQRSWAHRADLLERLLDSINPLFDLSNVTGVPPALPGWQ